MIAYFVTMVATSIAVGLLLTVRLGRRLGLKLMYALAALPGVVLVQVGGRLSWGSKAGAAPAQGGPTSS